MRCRGLWGCTNEYNIFWAARVRVERIFLGGLHQREWDVSRCADFMRSSGYFVPVLGGCCIYVCLFVRWLVFVLFSAGLSSVNLPQQNYRGQTTVFGKRYVTVINRNYQYHPSRYQAHHVLPFPSKSLPRKNSMLSHSHPNNYRANIGISVVSRYHPTKYRSNVQLTINN